ncbi:MAG: alanine dehydrogenase [Clostridia bacterium]
MVIGVPKEIKKNENRVSLTPDAAGILCKRGHTVLMGKNAGLQSGYPDKEYVRNGANILADQDQIYGESELILKVKEPLPEEYGLFRPGQILFGFLHLASNLELTLALADRMVTSIAYESVQLDDKTLPLLVPMSQIAGKLSVQVGAELLLKHHKGSGILLGGVPGVASGKVLIIGGGSVGSSAAGIAVGMGAQVVIMDINPTVLNRLDELFHGRVQTILSSEHEITHHIKDSDLVIGAVLVPNARPPALITEKMVKSMRKGSVIVDTAIDQGGIVENMYEVTSHAKPAVIRHGILHYTVPNIPGAVPRTSTKALTSVTFPYVQKLADKGMEALKTDKALERGLNTHAGKVVCETVARSLGLLS